MTQPTRRIILYIVTAFVSTLCFHEARAQKASPQTQKSSLAWHSFISNECGFSAAMPGVSTHTIMDLGQHKYLLTLENYRLMYAVIYAKSSVQSNDPKQVRQLLRYLIDGEIKTMEAHLDTEKSISLQGFPGREIAFHAPELGGKTRRTLMRIYIVNSVAYEVIASHTGPANDRDTQRFFRSFHLLKQQKEK
jgi:hypothetical protein